MNITKGRTVTGRFKLHSSPAFHQLPKVDPAQGVQPGQGYLFRRGTELISALQAHYLYPSTFVQGSEPGDLLLILCPGSSRKPELYSRRGNHKYLWRKLKGREDLIQQLQVLALLQQ